MPFSALLWEEQLKNKDLQKWLFCPCGVFPFPCGFSFPLGSSDRKIGCLGPWCPPEYTNAERVHVVLRWHKDSPWPTGSWGTAYSSFWTFSLWSSQSSRASLQVLGVAPCPRCRSMSSAPVSVGKHSPWFHSSHGARKGVLLLSTWTLLTGPQGRKHDPFKFSGILL